MYINPVQALPKAAIFFCARKTSAHKKAPLLRAGLFSKEATS
jgi:hypothetical protein